MYKIDIKLDLEKDAWNWWHACNNSSHGVVWKEKIDVELSNKIINKNQNDAYDFLIPYLKNFYNEIDIDNFIKKTQKVFDDVANDLFGTMERVSGNKIYKNNFTCFLTSFPRFPYNYEKAWIWISCKKEIDYQLSIFIHELLHFQFFKYYGEKVWNELGKEKHSRLKEAMTVIINDEFKHISKKQRIMAMKLIMS